MTHNPIATNNPFTGHNGTKKITDDPSVSTNSTIATTLVLNATLPDSSHSRIVAPKTLLPNSQS